MWEGKSLGLGGTAAGPVVGSQGVKCPTRPARASCGSQGPRPAGGGQVSSLSLRQRGWRRRQVQQGALQRELGACLPKGRLSYAPGSNWVQEIQGLPQQLGTPAPNGPKIPSADKGIVSTAGSSGQVGGCEREGENLDLSTLIGPGIFLSTFPKSLDGSRTLHQGASLAGPTCQVASVSSPYSSPLLEAQDASKIWFIQLWPPGRQ